MLGNELNPVGTTVTGDRYGLPWSCSTGSEVTCYRDNILISEIQKFNLTFVRFKFVF